MFDRLYDSFVPPVILAAASSIVASVQDNSWLAIGGFTVSAGWLLVGISREWRSWLGKK